MNKKYAFLTIIGLLVIAGLCLAFKTEPVVAPETPPQTAPQGKLNIDAVCQSALAYMTFTDGASAEAFVQECKDGKHPEVIERYKSDMNLGDGANI